MNTYSFVGDGGTSRLSIIEFSDDAEVVHSFSDTQTRSALAQDIQAMPYLNQYTNFQAAFEAANTEFETYGSSSRARVLLLLTDGFPSASVPVWDCPTWRTTLDAVGVSTFVMGVGANFSTDSVRCLVQSPYDILEQPNYATIKWTSLYRRFSAFSDLSLTLELDANAVYSGVKANFSTVRMTTADQLVWTIDKTSSGPLFLGMYGYGPSLDIPFHLAGASGATNLIQSATLSYVHAASGQPVTAEAGAMWIDLPTCTGDLTDSDGDGWPDEQDAFPFDPSDWEDTDADGIGDLTDVCAGGNDRVDTDFDGTPNFCDACPFDFYNDSDGDGTCDSDDVCPLDPEDDADDDLVCADADPCPWDADDDLDGDGICGDMDVCPEDPANDADGDGICGGDDSCALGDDTVDADGDGTADACDICPDDAANDADGDGQCADTDPCPWDADDDIDGDGLCADEDPCPLDTYDDTDGDAICDSDDPCPDDLENDADGDGFCEIDDLCPTVSDPTQADTDGDGIGDACEPDNDGDGVIDDLDLCPLVADATQLDTDGDGIGDACDGDDDGDGVPDVTDSCTSTTSGAVVLANGCTLDEVVACGAAWKNHGAYVSAMAHTTQDMVLDGLISWEEREALMTSAAQSSCGKK